MAPHKGHLAALHLIHRAATVNACMRLQIPQAQLLHLWLYNIDWFPALRNVLQLYDVNMMSP